MRKAALCVTAVLSLPLGGCGEHVFDSYDALTDIEDTWVDPDEPDLWSQAPTEDEDLPGRDPFGCKVSSGFSSGDRTRLSYAAVARLASTAGIECGLSLVKAVAVASAESGRYPYVFRRNRNCSLDRGLWQINSHFWKELSTYDATENADGMFVVSDSGTRWTPWMAYTNGSYKQFLPSACHAVAELCDQSHCD